MTKIKTLIAGFVAAILVLSIAVSAIPSFPTDKTAVTVEKSKNGITINIPEMAVEKVPGVFSIGYSVDPVSGEIVEGFVIIEHAKDFQGNRGNEKVSNGNGNDKEKEPTSACYGFLAGGAKWKSKEGYLVDPTNDFGFDWSFVKQTIDSSIEKWESASGRDVFSVGGLGPYADRDNIRIAKINGVNEIVFDRIDSVGVVAITFVYIPIVAPEEIVEFDQIYNTNFAWSSTGEQGKMDFENIATHELGHAFGLGHPDDSCKEETMYKFVASGETKKRTLELGDITGIRELYKRIKFHFFQ